MGRSSSSTHSSSTSMGKPSERSRSELPRQGTRASAASQPRERGPAEKKHKNMSEVRQTGYQSDQGGRPGRRAQGSRNR